MIEDIREVPADLSVPEAMMGEPAPGRRAIQTLAGHEDTAIHHLLYLPSDWSKGGTYPVIVEYAGNGPYHDAFEDVSDGTVEGSKMGYGISGGKGFIWVCMPYVNAEEGRNQGQWWGDVGATVDYCLKAVDSICGEYGGDRSALILAGFSRGAIACNYIGLHDDMIASLWRAFIPFSHYDGVKTDWAYPGSDRTSALARLKRLGGRPQFICNEGDSCRATEDYLKATGISGDFTFQPTYFRNHNDAWTLRDCETRRRLRSWLADVLKASPGSK